MRGLNEFSSPESSREVQGVVHAASDGEDSGFPNTKRPCLGLIQLEEQDARAERGADYNDSDGAVVPPVFSTSRTSFAESPHQRTETHNLEPVGLTFRDVPNGVLVKLSRDRTRSALQLSAILPEEVAAAVEASLFDAAGDRYTVSKRYKSKARELLFNLRRGRNEELRLSVLDGSLRTEDLVRMGSNELANARVRQKRLDAARQGLQAVTVSRLDNDFTVTERWECGDCGHNKTQYTMWQRKSAVDRYRILVQCLRCRHSWEL